MWMEAQGFAACSQPAILFLREYRYGVLCNKDAKAGKWVKCSFHIIGGEPETKEQYMSTTAANIIN